MGLNLKLSKLTVIEWKESKLRNGDASSMVGPRKRCSWPGLFVLVEELDPSIAYHPASAAPESPRNKRRSREVS